MKLQNKVCVITGAGKGIGRSTALRFAREGASVAVCDIDTAAVKEVVDEIRGNGGKADGYGLDVTKSSEIREMVDSLIKKYGTIDVLVNNAGILLDAQLHKLDEEMFNRVIDVNLKGAYLCTRAVTEVMREKEEGVIINSSSIVGIYGNFGQTNYAASKAGMIGMTKSWAKELGRKGIRVNVVCPGFINTTILQSMPEKVIDAMVSKIPLGRLGEPEEIADVFTYLASDESSYINGAVLEVSGGVTI